MYHLLFRHVLRRLDPERAHELAFAAIRAAAAVPGLRDVLARVLVAPSGPVLPVLGRRLPGRFGLAAGFDKDARGVRGLTMLGFAFVEVGTITPRAQPGNDRPRLWRVLDVRGVRNRMGFNNHGAQEAADRLRRLRATRWGRDVVIGVNIGKNKVTPDEDAPQDYAACARLLAPFADYLVVNVSSPNTPGLRALQSVDALRPVLRATLDAAAGAVPRSRTVPVLVKIAPDLADDDVDAVADLVAELGLAGVVAVNTTVDHDLGEGGLSGPPVLPRGLEVVRRLRDRLGPGALVVGVGGVTDAEDARAYRRAGADLVQGYTGFVYEGPFWASRINRALAAEEDRA
ncbi:quinone-dependent dihydroorotate dehydrogenase [Cellulomonas carbonis]|uniref:Dihydroorotate dehydrogenase (quinone) n=1 Tax=Cellulomonas carbonis T26 TaxID=947969 RepID=A0A0A0BMX9_9CELL|nr:quinone-dependent dihydroorotate dehydrogenase [Cellulomonas carbonis]KGM09863.1 diguanylate cyclase [Cellulomonas carbonis T26]GGB92905.1 dihydroorotate dehydrogenase (quinone) [Cellulomonas carbonis]